MNKIPIFWGETILTRESLVWDEKKKKENTYQMANIQNNKHYKNMEKEELQKSKQKNKISELFSDGNNNQ